MKLKLPSFGNLIFYLFIGTVIFCFGFALYYTAVVAPGHTAGYFDMQGQGEMVCVKKWDKYHENTREQCQPWSWIVVPGEQL
jgi:hypothetical protein